MGDTEIICWDYQSDATRSLLVMGGKSSSGDVVTHAGSGVLIMEDADTYETKWSRELYQTFYTGQNVRV